jgi:ABC-type dipeptide/oligopeptide/nickel transport system permease component
MTKYIIKRIIYLIITIAVVGTFLYLMLDMAMIRFWAPSNTSLEIIFKIAWRHFEKYVHHIYYDFDFGLSFRDENVWELVWPKFKLSMLYNITSLIIFVPVGIFLGVQAAIHKNKFIDVFVSVFSMVFNSIPSFVLIFFLVMFVGYEWDLLPPIAPYYSAPLGKQILGMIIPVFALTVGPIGKIAQLIKGELVEITNRDYFNLLRAKGLTYKKAIYRHGLKDAFITVLPEIVPTFMIMLGFSFVIESTYNIYGVSKLLMDSLIEVGEIYTELVVDTNVVMLIGMLLYITIMLAGLISDIVMGIIDPRINIASRKKGFE